MSNIDKLIYLGYIGKAHGIQGNVYVKSLTQNPADITKMPLQDEFGKEIILKLKSIGLKFLICSVKGVSDRNAAELLSGTKLYALRSALPAIEDSEYYIEDMKGLEVRNLEGKQIGKILTVHNFGAGDVIEVEFMDGTSEMYPFTHDFFTEVNNKWSVLAKLY